MSGSMDTIKSYLVSLGFAVDEHGYAKADQMVDGLGEKVKRFAEKFSTAGKAAGFFGAAIIGVTAATGKLLNGLGNQEIQMEMLSRQMWTTQKTAQAFSLTLQALHANIQQLYLSPTLMSQYRQLFAVANRLTPNISAYDAQIRKVQAISLQFKQMRLEMSYAAQWFGMSFIKDMSGPMGNLENRLKSLNNTIIKNIPAWTAKIASVAAGFFQSFGLIIHAVDGVYNGLQRLGSYLPSWVKVVAASFAAIGVIMASNPFFLAIEGITALLLLLDDYYVWTKGGKSALGGFWQSLTNDVNKFKQAMQVTGADKSITIMFHTLKQDLDNVQGAFSNVGTSLGKGGSFYTAMVDAGYVIKTVANYINDLLIGIGKVQTMLGITPKGKGANGKTAIANKQENAKIMNPNRKGPPLGRLGATLEGWLRQGVDDAWLSLQSAFGGHVATMSGDARLQAALKSGNNHPTTVTIHQTNQFNGTATQSDVMTGLNQSNTLMMRQFKSLQH